jgi:fimbrial chaperone protein
MRYLIPAFIRVPDAAPARAALPTGVRIARLRQHRRPRRPARCHPHRRPGRHSIEVTPGLLGYVLAGSSRRWPLDAAKLKTVGAGTKLEVRLNGEPATIDLSRSP